MFRDQVIEHLCWYKKNILKISQPGTYKYRGEDIEKHHILPTGSIQKRLNILEPYREAFFTDSVSEISFHRYFHHLNSSQALCINLFYPLMKEAISGSLLDSLGISQQIQEYAFEKESPIEKTPRNNRKTNFDFYIKTEKDMEIFFEIKFTEEGFGKAKNDKEHREKFEFTYKPLLENNPYIHLDFKKMDSFFNHYQILRNLVHLGRNSTVVFLFPAQNNRVNAQAKYAHENILTELGRESFHIIYLDQILSCILNKINTPLLEKHYSQFKLKYLHDSV